MKRFLSVFLCLLLSLCLLIPAFAETTEVEDTVENVEEEIVRDDELAVTEIGEGEICFDLLVIDAEGNANAFAVSTNEETVGAALLALGLIDGDESQYGLYVKTVLDVTADYDADGTYWAFYINGEYAMTGVDSTAIEQGALYTLVVEGA